MNWIFKPNTTFRYIWNLNMLYSIVFKGKKAHQKSFTD